VRQIFGFDDPEMLAAALLHDTLEDTTTDFDDLSERFTPKVANWVAALSKDGRKPHDEREAEYYKTLAEADWQVKAIKLADLYDNSNDSKGLSLRQMQSTWEKSRFYLDAIRTALPDSLVAAFQLVERRLDELKSSLTT
jgi:guanosine-3',5'-bis(diphosphate) 3'-pyrophosphohydrolase